MVAATVVTATHLLESGSDIRTVPELGHCQNDGDLHRCAQPRARGFAIRQMDFEPPYRGAVMQIRLNIVRPSGLIGGACQAQQSNFS